VTRILDGKAAAEAVREEVVRRIAALAERGVVPGIALVRVGDDPASESYVRSKNRMSAKVGIRSEVHALDAGVGPERLSALIRELNARADIHGILLQLPLPGGYEADRFLAMIEPSKDVDGFHPVNVGRVAQGLDGFVPCTPLGIQRLLVENDVAIPGRRVVILGRSILVGRPLSTLLSQKGPHADATVTLCHSRSRDLPAISREADILVAAMGRCHFVTAEMVREGAVVVDVGIHRVEGPDGASAITGDVDFEHVAPKTSAITPVPGGVGPMTVAMLLWNTTRAAERLCG
jgi:methylenetetrahydrofolate dehydrogenase (NADP+)/methenyltetrahydrofolate cyclohydrolase